MVIDLIKKYEGRKSLLDEIKKLNLMQTHPKFKAGQIIEFWGGYNGDIRYKSKITGFDADGEIYVLWDCYWFSIKDDQKRDIKIIN